MLVALGVDVQLSATSQRPKGAVSTLFTPDCPLR
jgi:hypothetical protein